MNQFWLVIVVADLNALIEELFDAWHILLVAVNRQERFARFDPVAEFVVELDSDAVIQLIIGLLTATTEEHTCHPDFIQIGRASCRERVLLPV